MLIRQAQTGDRKAVVACVQAAFSKYLSRMDREPAPMKFDYESLIAQGDVYVLVGEEEIRGVLVMLRREGCMLVENIAIYPRFQGQGLGGSFMAFVEEQAREKRLTEIRLYTNEVMTENLPFYLKLGFEEEDRRLEDGYHRIFLRKRLDRS